jgi:hypothetical protein
LYWVVRFIFFYDKLAGKISFWKHDPMVVLAAEKCASKSIIHRKLKSCLTSMQMVNLPFTAAKTFIIYRNEFEYLEVFKAHPQNFTKSFTKKMQDRKKFDKKSIQISRNKLI